MAGRQKGFYWKQETLFADAAKFGPRLERAITSAVEFQATRSESYMRSNASWNDQTGNARSGLHTNTEHHGSEHRIIFAHSVSYGIWLEIRWSGRYAIILPAVEQGGRELMTLLGTLLGRLGT